jgi:hypothetical protein
MLYSANTGTWTTLQSWSSRHETRWTPGEEGTYAMQVWVRQTGSTATYEAWAWSGYVVVTAAVPQVCSSVALIRSVSFPVPSGTPVTWTAEAPGCSAPEHRFWLYSAATNSWTTLQGWSSSHDASWTPAEAGTYVVQVWVRQAGSTATYEAWAWSGFFVVLPP